MALPKAFLPAFSAAEYLAIERASEIRHESLDGLVYGQWHLSNRKFYSRTFRIICDTLSS